MIDPQAGVKLAIFARADLAHDAGLPRTPPSATKFSIGRTVRSEAEVDLWEVAFNPDFLPVD
jgi:hypothetical protein